MVKRRCFSLLVASLLIISAASGVRAQEEGETAYRIGGGDVLEVTVWKNLDLSREVTVRPDGKISLPLISDIQAAGRTAEDLRDVIAQTLSAADLVSAPSVSVAVVEAASYRVFALGALETNGMYPLSEPVTALQLLAQAAGPAENADLAGAYILRGKVRIPVDLTIRSDQRVQPLNPWLVPGDVLVVPQREEVVEVQDEAPERRIIVAGEVTTPTVLAYREGVTVLDAFVEAGGGTEFADLGSVKVIRREEGAEERVIRVNLTKVMKKGDLSENIALVPGDIVVVP